MTSFPMAVAKMPSLVSVNIANNRQWSSEEALKGFKALATGPSREKIQLLYFNENSLEVVPKEIKNMTKNNPTMQRKFAELKSGDVD